MSHAPYLLAPLVLLSAVVAQADTKAKDLVPVPADRRVGFDSIDPDLCKKWLTYLASDELEGRETGKPGYRKAADFIAEQFAAFGLKPVGDNGTFFQAVPWQVISLVAQETRLSLLDQDGKSLLDVPYGRGFGGTVTEKSDAKFDFVVVKAKKAADLEDLDVEGKCVLFQDASQPGGQGGRRQRFSMLAFRLRRLSPGSIIMIDEAAAKPPATPQERSMYAGKSYGRQSRGFRSPNRYTVSPDVAQKILAAVGSDVSLAEMEPGAVAVENFQLQTTVTVKKTPAFAANVVGYLEGRDPKLKAEVVGIGSHLDHVGINGAGKIRNGADDDGSGTTGVLAVARAFSLNPVKPRRSILFMCFSGEEKGLIGSRYYAHNPIFPNESMVAEIQMDMIGRREEKKNRRTGKVTEAAADNINSLHLVGTKKLSMDLHETCIRANEEHIGFDFEFDEENVFYRSDHVNFAMKDIPIAFLFTGFHPQYHQVDDTVDKIDFPKLARVAGLAYVITWEVAEREERPKLHQTWKDVERKRQEQRRNRRRR